MVVCVKNKIVEAASGKIFRNMSQSYPSPSGLGKRESSFCCRAQALDFLKKSHLCGVRIGNKALSRALGDRWLAGGIEFGLFQVFEDFFGAGDNRVGEAGEAGYLDAVALVRTTG